MVDIYPFKGYRYNMNHPELSGLDAPLDDLITQPYDKISDEMQEAYYELSPYNFVRLIQNRGSDIETLPEDPYRQAGAILERWKNDEVLTRDQEPGFYIYETRFIDGLGNERRRTGFYGLAGLETFGDGDVHAHEHTMSGPKADRLKLLESTGANLEPIFFLYEDEEESDVRELLEQLTRREAEATARVNEDEEHRIWHVTDEDVISRFQKALQQRSVVIADGHHRYETALNYWQKLREQDDPAAPEASTRMGVFISARDPGLYIFPSHRVVRGLDEFNYTKLKSSLADTFETKVYPLEFDDPEKVDRQKQEFLEDIRFEGVDTHAFGVVSSRAKELLLLKLHPEDIPRDAFPRDRSERWIQLDVNLLSTLVLERELGITPEDVEAGTYLSYHRHSEEVFNEIENGDAQVGFVLNPTGVQEVLDVASAGERMPQKSTDFFPKIPSGLVFRQIEASES